MMYISKSTMDKPLFFQPKMANIILRVISSRGNRGNFDFRTPESQSSHIPAITASSGNAATPRSLAVKVVRADLNKNGKPRKHNLNYHINIYNKTDACVSYILERVKDEMKDTTLKLVGSTGLTIFDQFGTKVSNSI